MDVNMKGIEKKGKYYRITRNISMEMREEEQEGWRGKRETVTVGN